MINKSIINGLNKLIYKYFICESLNQWEIDYCKVGDNFPAKDFINQQQARVKEKICRNIEILKQQGREARCPLVDTLDGPIKELRIKYRHDQIRILFFFFDTNNKIVFTHSINKKFNDIPKSEIDKAKLLRDEYLEGNK